MRSCGRSTVVVLHLGSLLLALLPCAAQSPQTSPGLRSWGEYRAIMWIGDSAAQHAQQYPLFLARLRQMGINTAMVYGDANPQPLFAQQFPYYVENLVNRGLCLKFNSTVKDWDKFVTDWAKNGRPETALARDYCLDDPQWRDWAKGVVTTIVRHSREHQPVAYNLRDELSTTISANPFDYDFSPIALEGFRAWLKAQYPDLAALNAEWQTQFHSWEEVKPFTTDRIKNRMASGEALPRGSPEWQDVERLRFEPGSAQLSPTRWNFSPWADFRTYMDLSLARALGALREAAHELDPATPVGIEGTQMADAFGGYDLWRLSQVLDWVEPYDIGSSREIFGSFMPGKPVLTTVFESETAPARRRLWHLLLEGDRGCLVWWSEDCIDWKSPDLSLTPKAQALAPVLREMTGPVARVFLRAERERDPVFIHYSQPSIQVDWLLESTVDGSTWLRRFSSFEAEHNQMAKARTAWLKALQDLGYSPRFVSSSEIEQGILATNKNAVLILPQSWAMSLKECAEIESFISGSKGGKVLMEGPAGAFDEHGKLRTGIPPAGFLETAGTNTGCLALEQAGEVGRTTRASGDYLAERLRPRTDSAWLAWLKKVLPQARPAIAINPQTHVRIHRFRVKTGRLVAFERNIEYQMSEDLKQAGGNQSLEVPVEVEAVLPEAAFVYDLRSESFLGHTNRLRFTLDPWQPSLFALMPMKFEARSLLAR